MAERIEDRRRAEAESPPDSAYKAAVLDAFRRFGVSPDYLDPVRLLAGREHAQLLGQIAHVLEAGPAQAPAERREEPDADAALEERAYRAAVGTPVGQIARELQELLSRRVTAYLAGADAGRTVARWVNGEVTGIRPESERRLRAAYQIAQLLRGYESDDTVRAWFLGMNARLGDRTPAEALREGQLRQVLTAARAFAWND